MHCPPPRFRWFVFGTAWFKKVASECDKRAPVALTFDRNTSCYKFTWFIHLIIIVVVYVCECTIGVDVRDGTILCLTSVLFNIVMGCIVLGRQMNVYFTTTTPCRNTISFVRMDVRFCTMKIHDSAVTCNQTRIYIVMHRAIIEP